VIGAVPDEESRELPFWSGAREKKLLIQRCSKCGRYSHPPDIVCSECGSEEFRYEEVSGDGRLYAMTTFRNVPDGAEQPTIGVVELNEQRGLLLACEIGPEVLAAGRPMVGDPAQVRFDHITEHDLWVPQFDFGGGQGDSEA
jgi:uncharacterized OB-fold protein